MTARPADWLILLFCLGLAGCADRSPAGLETVLSACGNICGPLRRQLEFNKVAASPAPIQPIATARLPRKPAAPVHRMREALRSQAPLLTKAPAAPVPAPAVLRPSMPATVSSVDGGANLSGTAPGGTGGALPGSTGIVAPWFQPWPPSAI